MDFLDKLVSATFETSIKRDKGDVLNRINRFKSKVESDEFVITGSEVSILRTPNTFAPLRGYGRINVRLTSLEDKTVVVCHIHPYDNKFTIIVLIAIAMMGLWTITSYMISSSGTMVGIAVAWGVAIVGIVSYLLLNKIMLRAFTKAFISAIAE